MILTAIIIFLIATAGNCWAAQATTLSAAAQVTGQNAKNTNSARPQTIPRFTADVLKGQSFDRQIAANLFFRLIPRQLGWTISVGSTAGPENNFCGVVTPPYRGVNPIHIEGWHFRNSDNSGPNEIGAKNINAPQEVREFYFVLNDMDYRKAFDALQILLWPYAHSKRQIDEAANVHAKLPKGHGRLTIRDLKLNTLVPGKQAGIDRMRFDVELKL